MIKWLKTFLTKFFCFLIRAYQKCISPLFPPSCRFKPTCSAYALEAIQKYGPGKGLILAIRRILRCNPLSRGGYDPIPKIKKLERKMIIEKSIADIDKDNYLNRHFK